MSLTTHIVGVGGYLPERVMTNDDLTKIVDTSDEWITKRRAIADKYKKELSGLNLRLPQEHPDNKHAYYIYVVAHPNRDEIMKNLEKKDIYLNISYPWPIHIMDAYKHFVTNPCTHLEKTEEDAKKIFPIKLWNKLHLQIIFFGREYCPARNHDLESCPICSWAASKKRIHQEKNRSSKKS